MNRTIWIWRFVAVLILLIFAILMWNLYARLTSLNRQGSGAAAPLQSEAARADGTLHFSLSPPVTWFGRRCNSGRGLG